jgi:hypothetical protein
MDKQTIKNHVGPEIYAREYERARRAAPETGRADANQVYSSDIPHVIDDLIWDGSNGLSDRDKLLLMFAVYEDLPSYGILLFSHRRYQKFTPELQALFWQEVRRLLSTGDPALVGPLEYLLVIDFFELCKDCETIWHALLGEGANAHLVRGVLRCSATAPWHLKEQLYEGLIGDPVWHQDIYRSLVESYYTLYGQIDKSAAALYLDLLVLSPEPQELQRFKDVLSTGERYTNHFGIRLP